MGRKKKTPPPEKQKRKSKAESVSWTDDQDTVLLDGLVKKKSEGRMSENSFKNDVFVELAKSIEEKYPSVKGAPKSASSTSAHWQKVCMCHLQLLNSPLS